MSYLERYEKGDCEAVWDDLLELDRAVAEPPLRDEALAVARETVRRARANFLLIVDRLGDLGYELRSPEPVSPPPADAGAHLEQLERLVGGLPLSLVAWYEQLGGVDLRGTMSSWSPPGPLREGSPIDTLAEPERCYADPFVMPPLSRLLEETAARADELAELEPDEGLMVSISGDWLAKEGDKGGIYSVLLPERAVDTDIEVHRQTTFVEYLREAQAWGGFPGLVHYESPPTMNIERLTADLLPL